MRYEDFISKQAPKWPYPVNYGKENRVDCDVLVLGGGIAGCWAAIGAARKGARVALVEKSSTRTSGSGGSGVDHWHAATTNPACKVSPEEYSQAFIDNLGGYRNGIAQYITCRESYDCLLELEKMGVKVRDSDDEFKGAEFRDEATKLLFAYDYTNKHTVRVWGAGAKIALHREALRLGVKVFDRIIAVGLLTEKGKQGARVIGATGLNVHTGEFYIFKSRATVLSMAEPRRTWTFSTELNGMTAGIAPATQSGEGHAMAWMAGAELSGLEKSSRAFGGPYGRPQYGAGNAGNTWYACNIVDATGKEIPWVDKDGRVLKTISERYRPAPGQKFILSNRGFLPQYALPNLVPIQGAILARYGSDAPIKMEVVLPLYADLTSMPDMERRALWGLMIAQEARTLVPIYQTYSQAGFDPDKDMLQVYDGGWAGTPPPQWRQGMGSGLVVDWDLKSSLDGLYAAGDAIFAAGEHAYAAATGRYAGRKAADYALGTTVVGVDDNQVQLEKTQVYAPLGRKNGMDWKELNAGVCRVMQDYCGDIKNEESLKLGLRWFDELEAGESASACARNPHELMRLLEVFSIMTVGRMIIETCRARKSSNTFIEFKRSDYPEKDPPEWRKWVTIKLDGGNIKTNLLPLDFYGDMVKNYQEHTKE